MVLSTAALALAGGLPTFDEPVRSGRTADADTAVVIGVDDYAWAPDVPFAADDARAFASLLVYTRGIPMQHVRLLDSQATREAILDAVDTAARDVGDGGTVWIYFAGHGAADPQSGARILLGADVPTDPTLFSQRAVAVAELEARASASGAKVFMVLDACYNGASRAGTDLVAGRRFAVPVQPVEPGEWTGAWFAAQPDQLSAPLDAARHGAFTYFAIGALRGWADGELDEEADGRVTGAEAQAYVDRMLGVAGVTGQHPELSGYAPERVLTRGKLERGPDPAAVREAANARAQGASKAAKADKQPAQASTASKVSEAPKTAAKPQPRPAAPVPAAKLERAERRSSDSLLGHAAISTGLRAFPLVSDQAETHMVWHVEGGVTRDTVQAFLVGDFATWNGRPWEVSASDGDYSALLGDATSGALGAGGRLSSDGDVLRFGGHAGLQLAWYASPIEESAFEEEVVPALGGDPGTLATVGIAALVGPDVELRDPDTGVGLVLGGDIGWMTNTGLGLVVAGRVGAVANF